MKANNDMNLALLQIRSTSVGPGLSRTATLLFNRPIRSLMQRVGRRPINHDYDKDNLSTQKASRCINKEE